MKKYLRFIHLRFAIWLRCFLLLVIFSFQPSIFIIHAQNIGEAFYIYRNDGQIHGFLRGEVDSIAFSHYDLDSIYYDENVIQLVYTPDSVYRIPLAVIDSVAFVTPKTEYKPGVVNLSDNLMPYIDESDSLAITFNANVPTSYLPKMGDKLVTLDMNDIFPAGFAGQVKSVIEKEGRYVVECEKVKLENVFESLYQVSSVYGYEADGTTHSRQSQHHVESYGNKTFNLPKVVFQKTVEFKAKIANSDLAITFSPQLYMEVKPVIHVVSTLIINKEHGTYFSAVIKGDYDMNEKITYSGGVNWSDDFGEIKWTKSPIAPLTFAYFKPGFFVDISATASVSFNINKHITSLFSFDYSSKKQNVVKPICNGRLTNFDGEMECMVEGRLAGGFFAEAGITVLDSDIDHVGLRGELGVEVVGDAVLYNNDVATASKETKIYERLKNSSVKVNLYASLTGEAELGPFGVSESLPWRPDLNLWTWDIVPTFSQQSWEYGERLSDIILNAKATGEHSLIKASEIGMAIYNQDHQLFGTKYASVPYKDANTFPNGYSLSFGGLKAGRTYTAYPIVKLFGKEILASPSFQIGEEVTARTGDVTDVTWNSATVRGHVTGENATSHECGVCFAADGTENWKYITTNNRTSEGAFTVQLTDLLEDTKYNYCVYVNIEEEKLYGELSSFTTAQKPVINTSEVTDITTNGATIGGRIEYYDQSIVENYGVLLVKAGTNHSYNFVGDNISYDGTFTVTVSNLDPDTEYECYAYMLLVGNDNYEHGATLCFTTEKEKNISVVTSNATNVTSESVTLNGAIEDYDNNRIKEYGFYYYEDNASQVGIKASNIQDGVFSVNLSGLKPETTYTYFAYCVGTDGTTSEGERKTFMTVNAGEEDESYTSCPDGHHPHIIDLGLPSGTKWACCNVGASTPEGYGNYYAWGETQPKSWYDWDTYQYGSDWVNVVNIGSDIASTVYDAATANWGTPWRMPSKLQYLELINNCTSVWTQQNGVIGRKFTGPNGGTIFLPAAGYREIYNLESAGKYGTYWSSTLVEDIPYYAVAYQFNRPSMGFGYEYRDGGRPVRPVR